MSVGGGPWPGPNPWGTSGLDPDILDADSAIEYESEIQIGRRCFSMAQKVFSQFLGVDQTFSSATLSWHGTTVDVNEGSFAVVQSGSSLAGLVGEIVRVTANGGRQVYAYVVGETSDINTEISLTRRAFLAIDLLVQPPGGVLARVEVMI